MLLAIGYAVLALLLLTVVIGASAVHVQRKQLLFLADGAALDAADAVDAEDYFAAVGDGDVDRLPLTDAGVEAAVRAHLDLAPVAARLANLRVDPGTGTPDGRTAVAVLTARARLPVISSVLEPWSGGVPLRAEARAVALLEGG